MLSLLLLPLLFPQQSQEVDRWSSVLETIDAKQRPGLEFLLKHMPAADRTSLSVDWVVENVDYAYRAWQQSPWHDSISEQIFFAQILPYASINERREPWRKDFYERFVPLVANAKTPAEAAAILNNQIFSMLGVVYSTERPKANQSPYESIEAGMASCTGLSVLLIDACRAVGVPARFVGTPLWADGSGNHSWVEIWDQGWHFTGAAEPTGAALNQAWFRGRASQAVMEDPERAIYATSYARTPLSFPMVWQAEDHTVYAVNVTARYQGQEPLPQGHGRLNVRLRNTGGDRVARAFRILGPGDKILFQGTTRDDSFDANDHASAILPLGTSVVVVFDSELEGSSSKSLDLSFLFEVDQSLLDAELDAKQGVVLFTPKDLLWQAHVQRIKHERAAEMEAKRLVLGELEMPFAYKIFGDKPEGGRSLYISMHGGGGTTQEVNDQQWENQKNLYQPLEGVYLAPRAPTNTWNLWHQAHIDALLDRLIENLIVFEDVNPDRVFILGYSAGGDGVYQLAPRMADRWAAAAMMAGHPNETKADGLRNLPFTLHMGAEDSAYDRNKIAAQWSKQLDKLQQQDSGGYVHLVKIHAGKGHWMDRKDAAALPWMAQYTRNLRPSKIVWLQDDVTHSRFYWLKVEHPQARSRVVVEHVGQVFTIRAAQGVPELTIRLDDSMVDFNQDVVINYQQQELFRGRVQPSVEVLRKTLRERGDPRGMWSAEVHVALPSSAQ